jgi:hypothetical protein
MKALREKPLWQKILISVLILTMWFLVCTLYLDTKTSVESASRLQGIWAVTAFLTSIMYAALRRKT